MASTCPDMSELLCTLVYGTGHKLRNVQPFTDSITASIKDWQHQADLSFFLALLIMSRNYEENCGFQATLFVLWAIGDGYVALEREQAGQTLVPER
jgi:hypothetical protein